jgi:hypothetical protein
MKVYNILIITAFLLTVSLAVLIGCKYDVAEPMWDKPAETGTTVTITSIEPPQEATPGWNYITIHGTDFTGTKDTSRVVTPDADTILVLYNGVSFNTVPAEIVEWSSTSIKVRRPNLVSDSITVNVATTKALVEAKSGIYKISGVARQIGSFLDNVILSVVAVDNLENLYVAYGDSATSEIFKVTPGGQKTLLARTARIPTDARIGPDGRLYLLSNNRDIESVNLETGEKKAWYRLGTRQLRTGDFDTSRYFYTAGYRTDLYCIPPDSGSNILKGGYAGAQDSIFAMRVFNNSLYVAARLTSGQGGIWRHSIGVRGNLGAKVLVFDLSSTEFASRPMRGLNFNFSPDGRFIFIGFISPDPIVVVDLATNRVDNLYKGILPSRCTHFCFGTNLYGNKLYMISSLPVWTVYQVDVGPSGSPYN